MEYLDNLPIGWSDIKVFQYQDLIEYDQNTVLSVISKYIGYIEIISDIDYDIIEDMDVVEVHNIIKNLQWLKTSPQNKLKNDIGDYKLINLSKLTLGEYIDIVNFKKDLIKNQKMYLIKEVTKCLFLSEKHNKLGKQDQFKKTNNALL